MTASFMQPWFPFTVNYPSGDVDLANWFSPRIDVTYAGNRAIERDVVENVASFGRQLGIVSDAVLELAADKPGEKVARLKDIVAQIAEVKARRKGDVRREAEEAVARLAKLDEGALKSLLRRYAR
jgi:hypothetical protein